MNDARTDRAHPRATRSVVDDTGKRYYESRSALMIANDEGLTEIYNRFHDPDERDPRIAGLRDLRAATDRAVLNAYGWRDVPTDCEFLIDHEAGDGESPRKKKPWRYRWPDAVRDEVLARLLALNAERAAAAAAMPPAAGAGGAAGRRPRRGCAAGGRPIECPHDSAAERLRRCPCSSLGGCGISVRQRPLAERGPTLRFERGMRFEEGA